MLINQKDFEAPENFSVEVAEADDIQKQLMIDNYSINKPGTALETHDERKDIQRSRSTGPGEKKARVKSGIVNNKSMLYHKMNHATI